MKAYKCDRCGKYFDDIFSKHILEVGKLSNECVAYSLDSIELCPACYEQFIEFIQNG